MPSLTLLWENFPFDTDHLLSAKIWMPVAYQIFPIVFDGLYPEC